MKSESESHSVMSDSLCNSPGQNTRVGSCSLLQGIFPAQGSNPGLLYCMWILYKLSKQGSPYIYIFSVVQLPSRVRLFATPWTAALQASLLLTISQSLPRFMSIASVMPSSHLLLWHPLLLLPSTFPDIRVFFQWLGCLHRIAKILELQLQHQSFQWVFH